MSRLTTLRRVIFPHAYRIAWPALGNEIMLLLKASALASVVTVFDLMGQTRAIFQKTFDFSVYLWAALIYLCLTAIFVVDLAPVRAAAESPDSRQTASRSSGRSWAGGHPHDRSNSS